MADFGFRDEYDALARGVGHGPNTVAGLSAGPHRRHPVAHASCALLVRRPGVSDPRGLACPFGKARN